MSMRWSTTLVSAALLLVAVPVEGVLLYYILVQPTNNAILSMSGLDHESVQKWINEHPDEMRAAQQARASAARGTVTAPSAPARAAPAPAPAVDPLAGKIEPLEPEAQAVISRAPSQTKEEVRAAREALAAKLEPLRPSEPSALWTRASNWLSRLAQLEGEAPSSSAPADLLAPIDERSLGLTRGYDDEFDPQVIAFASVQLHPPKPAQIDLKGYEQRMRLQRWILPNRCTIELSVVPVTNEKQQRPWVGDRESVARLARSQNLLAIVDFPASNVSHGRAGNLLWTRITRRGETGFEHGATYVTRLPDQWLIVRLRSSDRTSIEIGDKFIQRIAPLDAKRPAVDAFDPSRVVESFADPFADPAPIIKASGARGLAALQAYVLRKGPGAPRAATRLLDELVSADPSAAKKATQTSGAALDVNAELQVLKSQASVFDKEGALKRLALAKPDASRREEVAAELERLVSGSDSTFLVEPACDALAVWWRPQSVTALLPMLEENVFPSTRRTHAMKALAQTGDKRAVYPIVRWIIKEPGDVVYALTTMGPVAEDEVIKLLRERNADVRKDAARILSEIGTNKCLQELRRAAADPRDATAAAEAKSAVATVLERVKQSKSPASTPATRPMDMQAPQKPGITINP
jgi:hypothetical protein